MYAIIRTGGKQYRVSEGDRLALELIRADEGAEVTFDDVLLVENEGAVSIGTPTVQGASVTARVEKHFRGKKVLALKYKNKTRQRTLHGHRQQHTEVEITAITIGASRRRRAAKRAES